MSLVGIQQGKFKGSSRIASLFVLTLQFVDSSRRILNRHDFRFRFCPQNVCNAKVLTMLLIFREE
jgi:hypothetical protein